MDFSLFLKGRVQLYPLHMLMGVVSFWFTQIMRAPKISKRVSTPKLEIRNFDTVLLHQVTYDRCPIYPGEGREEGKTPRCQETWHWQSHRSHSNKYRQKHFTALWLDYNRYKTCLYHDTSTSPQIEYCENDIWNQTVIYKLGAYSKRMSFSLRYPFSLATNCQCLSKVMVNTPWLLNDHTNPH